MQTPTLLTLLVGAAAILAGCASNTNTNTNDAPSGHGSAAGSTATRDALIAGYMFRPFDTGATGGTPNHVWLALDENRLQFLHWDAEDPKKASTVLFAGDGLKGKFCFGKGGVSREDYDAGFVHFHNAKAANWDAGHNNGGKYDASVDGWWLRHIGAVNMEMEMMGEKMKIEKGKVFPMMPADPARVPACAGGHAHGPGLHAQLLEAYDFQPFDTGSTGGTPNHVWRKIDDSQVQFLHFDHADPKKAEVLLFVGEGVKGRFCLGAGGISQADYDAGYVHFHNAKAANWDAGHNNANRYDASIDGWWLRHVGAVNMEMEMMGDKMKIEEGKVFPMMPADLAKLPACA